MQMETVAFASPCLHLDIWRTSLGKFYTCVCAAWSEVFLPFMARPGKGFLAPAGLDFLLWAAKNS